MSLYEWIGLIIAFIGAIFIAVGIYGIYYYQNFYTRATIASLIDSVGFLLICFGLIVYKGISAFSLKIFFLIILVLLLNPLANHYIVRGAHTSGHRPGKER